VLQYSNMCIRVPVVCFYKGTKILCAINGKDTYVPIEKIGQGTLVKTYKHGFNMCLYVVLMCFICFHIFSNVFNMSLCF
jgi:hypothetical protein